MIRTNTRTCANVIYDKKNAKEVSHPKIQKSKTNAVALRSVHRGKRHIVLLYCS